MAFQAAYFSLYGRTECTYEPAMTKAFLHGRTEAIRSVQPESVAFVRSFCSDDTTPRQKMDALKAACKRHTELTRECSKGLGQDRLLYALAAVAKDPSLGLEDPDDMTPINGQNQVEQSNGTRNRTGSGSSSEEDEVLPPMPAIFRDSGYATLNHSVLSTSNCGNPCLRMFGFGAVVPDGFGIGYIIKVSGSIDCISFSREERFSSVCPYTQDDAISICASSKHLQTQRFLDTLRAYLMEVHRMLIQLHREANAKPKNFVSDDSLLCKRRCTMS